MTAPLVWTPGPPPLDQAGRYDCSWLCWRCVVEVAWIPLKQRYGLYDDDNNRLHPHYVRDVVWHLPLPDPPSSPPPPESLARDLAAWLNARGIWLVDKEGEPVRFLFPGGAEVTLARLGELMDGET